MYFDSEATILNLRSNVSYEVAVQNVTFYWRVFSYISLLWFRNGGECIHSHGGEYHWFEWLSRPCNSPLFTSSFPQPLASLSCSILILHDMIFHFWMNETIQNAKGRWELKRTGRLLPHLKNIPCVGQRKFTRIYINMGGPLLIIQLTSWSAWTFLSMAVMTLEERV